MSTLNVSAIVVHCSASRWGDANEIRRWHQERGWPDIGYHAVILNGFRNYQDYKHRYAPQILDGKIEPGREDNRMGSHCQAGDMNHHSIGVCLVGTPGWYGGPDDEESEKLARACVSDPKLMYATARQVRSLVHYLAVKCKRFNIKPNGTIKVDGRTVQTISQHSDHDKRKPLCASMNLGVIRELVVDELRKKP